MIPKRTAFFIFIILLAVVLAGCGQSSLSKARELIDQANAHIEKANELDNEAEDIGKEIEALPNDAAGDQDAIKLGEQLNEKSKSIEKEQKEALKLFKRGKRLDLPKDSKEYFELETKASEAAVDLSESLVELTTLSLQLTEKIANGTLTQEEFSSFEEKFMKLNEKITKEDEKHTTAEMTADEFFKEKEIKKELERK